SKILADITGAPPRGYRAPLYEVRAETAGLLATHGFLYASNLQDSLWPYRHPGTPGLVELPATWILDDGPFFAFGLRPNLYRQIFPPSAVLSVWRDEFRGIHEVGGLTNADPPPPVHRPTLTAGHATGVGRRAPGGRGRMAHPRRRVGAVRAQRRRRDRQRWTATRGLTGRKAACAQARSPGHESFSAREDT